MSLLDELPELPPEGHPPSLETHLEMLDPDEWDLLKRLYEGPGPRELQLLRRGMWQKMAWIDVYPWLVHWFEPTGGWRLDTRRSGPMAGTNSIGVSWSFEGRHVTPGVFHGLPATGHEVQVQGFTVMGMGRGRRSYDFEFWRYIDWIGLYSQLGLAMNWRVPVTPVPFDPDDVYDSYDPRSREDPSRPDW